MNSSFSEKNQEMNIAISSNWWIRRNSPCCYHISSKTQITASEFFRVIISPPNGSLQIYEENKTAFEFIIGWTCWEANDSQFASSLFLSILFFFSSRFSISLAISLILTRTQIYVISFLPFPLFIEYVL